jgi:CrcB protein
VTPAAPTTVRADELGAVAVGGVVGALGRAWISVAVPRGDESSWPWATFVTNMLGCLLLGVLLDWVAVRHDSWSLTHPRRARLARPLLASGVLGGFTTFSTFSVEVRGMLAVGAVGTAVLYAVSSVVVGVALVMAGRLLAGAAVGRADVDVRADEDL